MRSSLPEAVGPACEERVVDVRTVTGSAVGDAGIMSSCLSGAEIVAVQPSSACALLPRRPASIALATLVAGHFCNHRARSNIVRTPLNVPRLSSTDGLTSWAIVTGTDRGIWRSHLSEAGNTGRQPSCAGSPAGLLRDGATRLPHRSVHRATRTSPNNADRPWLAEHPAFDGAAGLWMAPSCRSYRRQQKGERVLAAIAPRFQSQFCVEADGHAPSLRTVPFVAPNPVGLPAHPHWHFSGPCCRRC